VIARLKEVIKNRAAQGAYLCSHTSCYIPLQSIIFFSHHVYMSGQLKCTSEICVLRDRESKRNSSIGSSNSSSCPRPTCCHNTHRHPRDIRATGRAPIDTPRASDASSCIKRKLRVSKWYYLFHSDLYILSYATELK
jgi:hypothetical protein